MSLGEERYAGEIRRIAAAPNDGDGEITRGPKATNGYFSRL